MKTVVTVASFVDLVAFVALAALAASRWRARRDEAAGWIALALFSIAAVSVAGRVLPVHPHDLLERIVQRLDVAVLLLFPALLFGFTTAFQRASRRVRLAVTAMTSAMLVWTFLLPHFPAQGEPRSGLFIAYLVGFLLHWTVLAVIVSWRLWRAGRGQPTVARRRMQMFAVGAAAITVALFGAVGAPDPDSVGALVTQLLAFVCAIAFGLALAPPEAIRILWRRPEQLRLQQAVQSLVELAMTREEAVARVLMPMAEVVGASSISLRDREGKLLGSLGLDGDPAASQRVVVETKELSLEVWTSRYAPYFGDDELRLLQTMVALTGLALDRVRLFQTEHEARLALERANELQLNFVALAAHELRTPVTTIHGFVRTLNHLGTRLTPEQREELRVALEQQTTRMASLVEQLLDLSRLDAAAIQIRPQQLDVSARLRELAITAAGARVDEVRVEAPEGIFAAVDPDAFDRVVSNLVTNALRYGAAPVTVTVEEIPGRLRVLVEDRGNGVPPEFVPNLFERFARAGVARDRVAGTGLGLAIARAYARAHGGDLVYEDASPHGARFVFEVRPGESPPPGRSASTKPATLAA